jgi:hypothetical protein
MLSGLVAVKKNTGVENCSSLKAKKRIDSGDLLNVKKGAVLTGAWTKR